MDPGELDKLIKIALPQRLGRDGAGAPITLPAAIARVWAKVIQQGGREFIAGEGEQTVKRAVFRIWARSDFDSTSTVTYGGQVYEIADIRAFDDVTEIHGVTRRITP